MTDNYKFDRWYQVSQKYQNTQNRFTTLLRLYSMFGGLIALFAGAYFATTLLPNGLTNEQRITFLIAGVGVALGMMSRALLIIQKEKEARKDDGYAIYKFMKSWKDFERVSKESILSDGKKNVGHSLRSIISTLEKDGKINEADVQELELALHARNSLVHGGETIPATVAMDLSGSLFKIIKKLTGTIL